jgi:predicted acetyltransferase
MIELNEIQLIPATLADYPVIQNMGRFYVYDMSEYLGHNDGWEIPEDGLYECIDLKKYWETGSGFPFLICHQNELAGFAIVDNKGSDASINYNMAQFFILRKFKNKGLGQYVAHQLFNRFKGTWEVMVMPDNIGAYQFWKKVISKYDSDYQSYDRAVPHFNNKIWRIFKLSSE